MPAFRLLGDLPLPATLDQDMVGTAAAELWVTPVQCSPHGAEVQVTPALCSDRQNVQQLFPRSNTQHAQMYSGLWFQSPRCVAHVSHSACSCMHILSTVQFAPDPCLRSPPKPSGIVTWHMEVSVPLRMDPSSLLCYPAGAKSTVDSAG